MQLGSVEHVILDDLNDRLVDVFRSSESPDEVEMVVVRQLVVLDDGRRVQMGQQEISDISRVSQPIRVSPVQVDRTVHVGEIVGWNVCLTVVLLVSLLSVIVHWSASVTDHLDPVNDVLSGGAGRSVGHVNWDSGLKLKHSFSRQLLENYIIDLIGFWASNQEHHIVAEIGFNLESGTD